MHHFYNKEAITPDGIERSKNGVKLARGIWAAFYVLTILGIIISMVNQRARKATTSYHDRKIVIEDTLGLLTDEDELDELEEVLDDFQDQSGVTPYILVIDNGEWKDNYSSLEDYAYDYYVNEFNDEMHWLIVYSTDCDEVWEDWYWEGMQGDDTDVCLTTENNDIFRKSFQKYALNRKMSLAEALTEAFSDLNGQMFERHLSPVVLIATVAGVCLHAGLMYIPIGLMAHQTKMDMIAFELPEAQKKYKEDTCMYCGGMFIHGIHISCPHCGGALPPADGPVFVEDTGKLKT